MPITRDETDALPPISGMIVTEHTLPEILAIIADMQSTAHLDRQRAIGLTERGEHDIAASYYGNAITTEHWARRLAKAVSA